MQKISAHGVDLPLDCIARDGPLGPPLGNHRTDPPILNREQRRGINRLAGLRLRGLCIQRIAVQCEVHCSCNNSTGKYRLELGSGLKPLH